MHYPFKKIELSYPFNGLEPYLDEEIIRVHYNGHYESYVNKLNNALKNYPPFHSWPLEKLIYHINYLPEQIQNDVWVNAGGVYNHEIYFKTMTSEATSIEDPILINAINQSFRSFESFISTFKIISKALVGSGYVWLVCDEFGKLSIITTINQNTTIPYNLFPLLGIDLWEHSYYLQYLNKRDDYIDAWINLIDFSEVEKRFRDCLKFRHQKNTRF